MATQVIKSVGATGRDYATWQLACAAYPLDLVAADENWIFEFHNDAEFDFQVNAAYLSSGTGTPRTIIADATRTVTFRTAAGQGIRDHANKGTNPIRYDQSKGVGVVVGQGAGSGGLFVDIPYATIDGIQFRSAAGTTHLIWATATGSVVKNSIVKCAGGGQWPVKLQGGASFINSVLEIVGSSGPWGGVMFAGAGTALGVTVFCEASAQTRAFYNNAGGGGGITIKDCVAVGCSSFLIDYNSSTGAGMWSGGTYSHNASDTTIPVGTNNVESFTAANQFVNIASAATLDLRPKAGNSLQAGVTDALMGGVDLLGTTRAGAPTIGAVEYVAGGGVSVVVDGAVLTGTGSIIPGTADGQQSITVDGAVLTGTGQITPGTVSTGATGSFTSAAVENNAGSALANTAVYWRWSKGAGVCRPHDGETFGTGTTDSLGRLTVTGIPAGEGDLLYATPDNAHLFAQHGTAV